MSSNGTATSPKAPVTHISAASLNNLSDRISYLRSFISFTPSDALAITSAAPLVAPLVPVIVEAVYDKLLSFDITAQSFVPRQTGYTGTAPSKIEDLSQEHPQIKFRKDFLAGYLKKLVTMDYEKPETWQYLDKVALMHTGAYGKGAFKHRKSELRVEYIHCAILLGFVEDVVIGAVMGMEIDHAAKVQVVAAFNKLLWIQNDLFARHYIADAEAKKASWSEITISSGLLAAAAVGLVAFGAGLARYSGMGL
ncbi:Protoglobin-domain-containing protein [Pyronema omphalodes]|nr:Protoglobin-domain-containing protein [Pyronema omphalodes]